MNPLSVSSKPVGWITPEKSGMPAPTRTGFTFRMISFISGKSVAARSPPPQSQDVLPRFLLQAFDQREGVSRDKLNIPIGALAQSARKDILLQVRVRVGHAELQSNLVRPASHQNGIKPLVLGTNTQGIAQVSRKGLRKGIDQIREVLAFSRKKSNEPSSREISDRSYTRRSP
jgi:hypothetical protein